MVKQRSNRTVYCAKINMVSAFHYERKEAKRCFVLCYFVWFVLEASFRQVPAGRNTPV